MEKKASVSKQKIHWKGILYFHETEVKFGKSVNKSQIIMPNTKIQGKGTDSEKQFQFILDWSMHYLRPNGKKAGCYPNEASPRTPRKLAIIPINRENVNADEVISLPQSGFFTDENNDLEQREASVKEMDEIRKFYRANHRFPTAADFAGKTPVKTAFQEIRNTFSLNLRDAGLGLVMQRKWMKIFNEKANPNGTRQELYPLIIKLLHEAERDNTIHLEYKNRFESLKNSYLKLIEEKDYDAVFDLHFYAVNNQTLWVWLGKDAGQAFLNTQEKFEKIASAFYPEIQNYQFAKIKP